MDTRKLIAVLLLAASVPGGYLYVHATPGTSYYSAPSTSESDAAELVYYNNKGTEGLFQGIIVPAYFAWWNTDGQTDFQRLQVAAAQLSPHSLVVIINPSSGPGPLDWSYRDTVKQFVAGIHASNQLVLGYVSTSYGRRDIRKVMADIQGYSFFDVDGIFFDEASTDDSKREWYESIITDTDIVSNLGRYVLNYGTYTSESLKMASVLTPGVIMSESTGFHFLQTTFPSWVHSKGTNTICMIHSTDREEFSSVYFHSKRNNFDYIYITERSLATNPWLNLPVYWDQLVGLVKLRQSL